ncbi:hypothetical protein QJS04_geneDACA009891 [Acorus gramineus]|uniref:Uncharacterized protein n=1 Tax=Acorus gramineus TaxID=55184 RepID=A0AAV9BBI9_ACOGR|nr:hypothetical protein QJS04_geneDACA009891 [Acorus gramineus]
MSTDSNMGSFNSHNMMPPPPPSSPIYNRLAINFQSGAVNSMSPMNPLMNPGGMGGMTVGMYVHGNSGMMSSTSTMSPSPGGMSSTSAMNLPGSSIGGPFIDQMPAIKHDTGLSVDWSVDEQAILEDGLVKFSDEPNIMRYIKIAATLRDKTVRDVALRCRWMTKKENGKRRKPEECYTGKKMKDRKDNLVDPALNPNISLPPQTNVGVYPAMMQHRDQISCAATMADDQAGFLLKENIQAFHQISCNLHNLKIERYAGNDDADATSSCVNR